MALNYLIVTLCLLFICPFCTGATRAKYLEQYYQELTLELARTWKLSKSSSAFADILSSKASPLADADRTLMDLFGGPWQGPLRLIEESERTELFSGPFAMLEETMSDPSISHGQGLTALSLDERHLMFAFALRELEIAQMIDLNEDASRTKRFFIVSLMQSIRDVELVAKGVKADSLLKLPDQLVARYVDSVGLLTERLWLDGRPEEVRSERFVVIQFRNNQCLLDFILLAVEEIQVEGAEKLLGWLYRASTLVKKRPQIMQGGGDNEYFKRASEELSRAIEMVNYRNSVLDIMAGQLKEDDEESLFGETEDRFLELKSGPLDLREWLVIWSSLIGEDVEVSMDAKAKAAKEALRLDELPKGKTTWRRSTASLHGQRKMDRESGLSSSLASSSTFNPGCQSGPPPSTGAKASSSKPSHSQKVDSANPRVRDGETHLLGSSLTPAGGDAREAAGLQLANEDPFLLGNREHAKDTHLGGNQSKLPRSPSLTGEDLLRLAQKESEGRFGRGCIPGWLEGNGKKYREGLTVDALTVNREQRGTGHTSERSHSPQRKPSFPWPYLLDHDVVSSRSEATGGTVSARRRLMQSQRHDSRVPRLNMEQVRQSEPEPSVPQVLLVRRDLPPLSVGHAGGVGVQAEPQTYVVSAPPSGVSNPGSQAHSLDWSSSEERTLSSLFPSARDIPASDAGGLTERTRRAALHAIGESHLQEAEAFLNNREGEGLRGDFTADSPSRARACLTPHETSPSGKSEPYQVEPVAWPSATSLGSKSGVDHGIVSKGAPSARVDQGQGRQFILTSCLKPASSDGLTPITRKTPRKGCGKRTSEEGTFEKERLDKEKTWSSTLHSGLNSLYQYLVIPPVKHEEPEQHPLDASDPFFPACGPIPQNLVGAVRLEHLDSVKADGKFPLRLTNSRFQPPFYSPSPLLWKGEHKESRVDSSDEGETYDTELSRPSAGRSERRSFYSNLKEMTLEEKLDLVRSRLREEVSLTRIARRSMRQGQGIEDRDWMSIPSVAKMLTLEWEYLMDYLSKKGIQVLRTACFGDPGSHSLMSRLSVLSLARLPHSIRRLKRVDVKAGLDADLREEAVTHLIAVSFLLWAPQGFHLSKRAEGDLRELWWFLRSTSGVDIQLDSNGLPTHVIGARQRAEST